MPTTRKPRVTAPAEQLEHVQTGGVLLDREEFDALTDEANAARELTAMQPFIEDEEDSAVDRVATMLQTIGDDPEARAIVKVYRITGPNKFAFATEYPVAEFEKGGLNMIRDQWGPGEYQIRLYGIQPGTTRFNVRGKQNVEILAPLIQLPSGHGGAPAPDALALVLQRINDRIDGLQRGGTQGGGMLEMLGMLKAFKDAGLLGGQTAPIVPQLSPVDQMKQLLELRDMLGQLGDPPVPKDPDLMGLASQAMSLIGAAAKNAPAPAPITGLGAPVRLVSPVPAAAARPLPSPATTGAKSVSTFDLDLMKRTLGKLVIYANQGDVDPVDAAATLANSMDLLEEQDAAFAMLENEQWFQVLTALAPEVAPHREWLGKVRDEVLAIFAGEDDPASAAAATVVESVPAKPVKTVKAKAA